MSVKPITQTLGLLHGGLFLDRTSELFAGVVRGVEETGKPGKLTITLDVKKVNAAVCVLAKVTDRVPEATPDADLFYATVEGNLSLDNPNQRKLDLRVASGTDQSTLRGVDPSTGEIRAAG